MSNKSFKKITAHEPQTKPGNWSTLLRLIRFTKPYKWTLILLVGLGLLNVGFNVLKPLPVKFIIDNVLLDHPLPESLHNFLSTFGDVPGQMGLLALLVLVSILIVAGSSATSYFSTHVTTRVCQKLVHDLSVKAFDKMQRLSVGFYAKSRIGQLMQRLSGDMYAIYSLVGGIMMPTLLSVTSLIAMFYIMARINLELALIAISAVPAFAVLLMIFKKPITESAKRQYEMSGKLWSFLQQSLTSMKTIQAYTREAYTNDIYRSHINESQDAAFNSTRISTVYNTLGGVLSGIATAIVVGLAAMKNINGTITIGELFVFIGYIGALFGPVNSIAATIQAALTITVRGDRVFEIIDSKETVAEKPNAIRPKSIDGNIEFRNVSFGYGQNQVLRDFNFYIPSGKMVAIIGPTGAGKTSLISLLLRFYDPWEGEILLDGYNLKDLKLETLRSNISLVLQDSLIFPITLKENIAFGDQDATLEEVMEAAKIAQAHDFIMKLPDGYETVPSEGGVSLSGGEKQRISLARALLKKSPILILDEPTSAMDIETEAEIFRGLEEYASGKTVFIISHRLSVLRHVDVIMAIRDGRIEQLNAHEISTDESTYTELYHLK